MKQDKIYFLIGKSLAISILSLPVSCGLYYWFNLTVGQSSFLSLLYWFTMFWLIDINSSLKELNKTLKKKGEEK